MAEEEALGPEALDALVVDAVLVEAVGPVADGVDRDREEQDLGLVGAALAHPARLAVGKGRQQRARVAGAVAVVEVVDRDLPVEQDRLLDAPQPQQADVEVIVLLGAADAEREVVGTADEPWVRHALSSLVDAPSIVLEGAIAGAGDLDDQRSAG